MIMADKDKTSNRTLLLCAAGGGLLFLAGRAIGRRSASEDVEGFLSDYDAGPPVDSQLADTAAHASSLSHQLYEISRRLREAP